MKKIVETRNISFRTVLIGSMVLLLLGAAGYTTAVALRSALRSQEYATLTDSAAAAGVAFAEGCLRANNNTVTWSSDMPLKPNTDCTGTEQESLSKYVKVTADYRTYFTVGGSEADEQEISAASQGHVDVLHEDSLFTWDFGSDGAVSALAVPGDGTPIGTSISGYWTSAPTGYLLENGQAVSRTTYADLYSVIGTTYGAGDGSTTFNVPNSTNRVQVGKGSDTNFDVLGETGGATTHTHSTPAHTHNLSGAGWARIAPDNTNGWWGINYVNTASWPANKRTTPETASLNTTTSYTFGAMLDGATDSGGASTTGSASSLQPYITVNRAIKY